MARIVQLVADGNPGGGTTAVLTLSALLAARGHEVHLVSQTNSYLLEEARRAGLAAHGLDFSRRWKTPATALQLVRLLNKLAPKVVHSHGARAGLPVSVASALVKRRGVRLAYTVHGFHYVAKRRGVRELARAAEALCMGCSDWTNFVSDGDRDLAQREGLLRWASAHSTIKNAVSMDPNLRNLEKRYDVGFVGRLTPQKNPMMLARIFEAMRPAVPHVAVIGGGELEQQLKQKLDSAGLLNRVELHGICNRTRALELLAQCKVLVLPSLWEGHPITLVEAALLGIPAVASDIPGNDEIIVHGKTGYLVPVQDPDAYAARISQLLADDDLRTNMGEAARVHTAAAYSTEALLAAHMRGYGL